MTMDNKTMLGKANATAYSVGWLDGMSSMLWSFVGDRLSDEAMAEYDAHVARLRDAMGIEKVETK